MPEEILHLPEPNAEPEAGLSDFLNHADDYRRYAVILQKVIHLIKSCTSLAMGATTKLTVLKFHVGLMEFTWDLGTLKREK